jgi:hypothetical protein
MGRLNPEGPVMKAEPSMPVMTTSVVPLTFWVVVSRTRKATKAVFIRKRTIDISSGKGVGGICFMVPSGTCDSIIFLREMVMARYRRRLGGRLVQPKPLPKTNSMAG